MKRRERKRYEKLFGDKPVYEMTEEEKQEPISRKVGKTLKHRLERRWYRRLVEINIIIVVAVVGMFISNFSKNIAIFKKYGWDISEDNICICHYCL